MPKFKKKINKFQISKYPITEYQYLQFIRDDGYSKKEYWCENGYKWKNKNNITLPLYWIKEKKQISKELIETSY